MIAGLSKENMINSAWIHRGRAMAWLLFLSCLGFNSCKNDPREIEALVDPRSVQVDRAQDVTIIFSENGLTQARLFAQEFIRNDQALPPYIDMKGDVRMELFGDSLETESVLTAGYARYYEKQGNILIRDQVVVHNRKGENLFTDELVYHRDRARFYTEKPVRVETPDQIIYGDGLEANEDFSWYEILHPKGVVQVEKSSIPD